jgi:hypothetical protein
MLRIPAIVACRIPSAPHGHLPTNAAQRPRIVIDLVSALQ